MDDGPLLLTFDEGSGVLRVSGDVDEVSAVDLRRALATHSGDPSQGLVVDLSAVTLLPSLAVGVLAKARENALATGVSFEMVAADGSVAQRVLGVCAMPYRN